MPLPRVPKHQTAGDTRQKKARYGEKLSCGRLEWLLLLLRVMTVVMVKLSQQMADAVQYLRHVVKMDMPALMNNLL